MSKHNTTPSTLSRRLTALLAALALLTALTLPVYAEGLEVTTQIAETVETVNETETTDDESVSIDPDDATNTTPADPTDDSTTAADDAADDATPSTDDTDTTPAGDTTTDDTLDAPDEDNDTVNNVAEDEDVAEDETTDGIALYDDVKEVDFDIYFALPKEWEGAQKISFQGMRGNTQPDDGYSPEKTMTLVDDANKTTKDGKKVYKVTLHYKHGDTSKNIDCSYGGFAKITFTKDDDTASVISAKLSYDGNSTTQFWQKYEDLQDCYYDSDTQEWISISELKPRHTHFADQTFTFKNMTANDLANVQAVFYDKAEGSAELVLVETVNLNTVSAKGTATIAIPDKACAYVAFFADGKQLGSCFNFCNDDSTTANVKSFLYSTTQNCFVYTTSGNVVLTENGARKIYYDATFSKLSLNTGNAIPSTVGGNVYYYMYKSSDKYNGTRGQMTRLSDDLYSIDAKEDYDYIIFASYDSIDLNNFSWKGSCTDALEIPSEDQCVQPCFYADTGDASMFNSFDGNRRDGYWAELGTFRNAEEYKENKTVVNIHESTFNADSSTKYIDTTLYDYYSDWELNGNNRDSYDQFTTGSGDDNNFACNRNWVTFGQFDQALSDYYQGDKAQTVTYPMYTGQFQPAAYDNQNKLWGFGFSDVASSLNLYGYDDTNVNKFMAVNNSTMDINGTGKWASQQRFYAYTFQGLTGKTLVDGNPVLYGTNLTVPYFNRDFLLNNNSKNAKLGEVYDNVLFPFTKETVFKNSGESTVEYWYFDSNETTLYLKKDKDKGYFLQESNNKTSSRNLKSNSDYQNPESYGFFPFNEDSTNMQASTYNYGFGAKLQFEFTMTDDGQIYGTDGETKVPIKFFFSGDDDVWVYIDNDLALDVGGDHGKASGLLEFGTDGNGNVIYTPYVSDVKTSNTAQMYDSYPRCKSIQYLNAGNTITFNYKGKEKTITTGTHTLTMYYMERGMWESNMAIAFNFPDHNELQVQKIVDDKNVNELFAGCFDDQKLFNFTIRNQATHYGTVDIDPDNVSTINLLEPGKSNPSQNSFTTTATPATTNTGDGNIFTKVDSPPDYLNVEADTPLLKWYAQFEDLTPLAGSNKEKRYGKLELSTPIDITGMSYLSFDIYVDSSEGDAALSNMYLQLRDSEGRQKGCLGQTFIGGKMLYGQVEMHNNQWITVKLSLDDMQADANFDWSHVKELRFGCNYPRNIYLRNIVFSAKAVPQKITGFTTKQQDIADYGSAQKGKLMPAVNAQYTSDAENGTMVVDENGGFVLQNKETITFKDQFRRGSYLSINEQVDTKLFDTKWTIFEDDEPVKSTTAGDGTKLKLEGASKDLEDQPGTAPDDGRIENRDAEGEEAQTGSNSNKYDGTKPSTKNSNDNTIVFRSYKNPDATDVDGETKLKVLFVNTVKTGSLTIKKEQDGKGEDLTGTEYTFRVRFTNVGGHALEKDAIEKEYTVAVGTPCTINNIPVGTRFTIEEVTPTDGSKLTGVSVTGGGSDTEVLSDNTVRGSIVESDQVQAEVTFTNTKQDLLDITGTKVWQDADGNVVTSNRPTIYVQLQRRHKAETDAAWEVVEYQKKSYQEIKDGYGDMKFSFLGLPAKDYASNQQEYEYRVVEGYLDGNEFVAVEDKGTISIGDKVYGVTYEVVDTAAEDKNNAKRTVTITNQQQNPKFALDITKKDAENVNTLLKDVVFTLEKVESDGNGNFNVDSSFATRTGVTNDQGKLIWKKADGSEVEGFTDLEAGTYRLTETKAAMDYNLLSEPIIIIFSKDGQCKVGDDNPMQANEKANFTGNAANGYTLSLTVLNRKTPTLPHTGADAPSLWLLIGLPLAVAGLLILVFRYNKKGGRTR